MSSTETYAEKLYREERRHLQELGTTIKVYTGAEAEALRDADIKQNRYSENQFSLLAFPLKEEAGKKVDQDREQKKRNIVQLTESIEDDTRRGQEQVFIFE